ncbi:MAG: hypothetical protein M1818_006342 [Claussenomyces sp. TS43310]|nr:MAG: hypothetical protein M1818_006342 [Claussenomyces sp. TS43310]
MVRGDVVRIRPNGLSYTFPASWTDIYGHASKDRRLFRKSEWYRNPNAGETEGLASEINPEKHRASRRLLSHAFSSKALRDQSTVVMKYVNMFVDQVKAKGNVETGVNATEWYNWITFDRIGDLAFGESFGAVEKGMHAVTLLCLVLLLSSYDFAATIIEADGVHQREAIFGLILSP